LPAAAEGRQILAEDLKFSENGRTAGECCIATSFVEIRRLQAAPVLPDTN